LTGDPNVDISTLSEERLREMGLSPEEIKEIMELKKIYDTLNKPGPVDPKSLMKDLQHVQNELTQDAAHDDAFAKFEKQGDNQKKVYAADIINDIMLSLPSDGSDLTPKERAEMERKLLDVASGITGNQNIDLANITEEELKTMGLSQDEIDEIMKLKNIYNEIHGEGPINTKQLFNQLSS